MCLFGVGSYDYARLFVQVRTSLQCFFHVVLTREGRGRVIRLCLTDSK